MYINVACLFISAVVTSIFKVSLMVNFNNYISLRSQVYRLIEQRQKIITEEVIALLSRATNVSVTLDIWSDRVMRGFLAITAHFTSASKMQTVLLTCSRMTGL